MQVYPHGLDASSTHTRHTPHLTGSGLQDGSEYWVMAANLKRIFEEKFAKAIKDDEGMWMSVTIESSVAA